MAKRKKRKIDIMYDEYGENEGSVCRNCCNFGFYRFEEWQGCKCKAFGIDRSGRTNWDGRYTGCGLYNMPFNPEKYRPAMVKYKGGDYGGKRR